MSVPKSADLVYAQNFFGAKWDDTKKFAIRPYLGGVNGISGLSLFRDTMEPRTKQDYVLLPNQKRLDGIAFLFDVAVETLLVAYGLQA